jgi:MSHA biogenesis protein MshJ
MSVMTSYKKHFYQIKAFIEQSRERDRILIVSLVLLVTVSFWFVLLYKPVINLRIQADQKSGEIQKSTEELTAKKVIIESVLNSPNTPGLLARYEDLKQKIKEIDAQVARFNRRFISKKDLSKLLHDMLKQTMGLTIESFSTVVQVNTTSQKVVEKNNTTESDPSIEPTAVIGSTQYRLVLKGSYFQVMNYLQRVEQLRWNLYWDKLDYQVTVYPEARVTIEFFTLKPESEQTAVTPGGTH